MSKRKTLPDRMCECCGKMFHPDENWRGTRYCSDECRKGIRRGAYSVFKPTKEKPKSLNKILRELKKNRKEIDKLAVAAKKAGMSYGQYVVMINAQKEREEKRMQEEVKCRKT